ncbi:MULTISPECIES: efflux transporter outer membrane subunit [unclassified Massilia]|uniref:efflux transporter outer membrane subunit n=1 Tax=unclassified Massilia TaxID=2609279 RepID=UPI00177AFD44|nr:MULTISPECIES: efflux transporter outer membrane subunit [unclassified Massilia]MBD8528875.1 efflux transporter outer membrane subunit [Massilia sp. CFBP 13647]MBD8673517.1 efflux transporter outer membrane subunit [Massilia sp. CFBP 13721]
MSTLKLIVTPLALAMVLSGCMSLAPKYERPAAPVAPSFPELPKTGGTTLPTATSEAPANLEWQRFFADARLRQLIELSLANNRDLRVAILNIEQARAQYRITRADRVPTVSAIVSGNRQTTGEDTPISSIYQGGFGVSNFELDLFGRVRNLSEAALAQYLATEEARKTTQISLIASVANTYLTMLADDELLAITEQTLKTREESDRLTRLRFENGVVSKLELQQSVSLVETARAELARFQRQRLQDVNLLTLLVGQTIPDNLAPGATLATTELPDLPAGMPSDLLIARPDIRAAEQQLIAANANIGAARANYFPRISLTGSVGSASTELSGLFKSGSYGWTFAPQAVLPIFDLGRIRAGVDSARAGRDIAVARYEQSIQTAFREVADALAGQSTFSEQLRAQRAVALAEQDRFDLSDLRYRSGAASYLDLLDAQRSLFQAQQLTVQANLQRLQNQVTLYRVLGGGWSEAQAGAPAQAAR